MESAAVTPTAKEFFSGLVDYAGLFPPAALSLGESIANYRQYLDRADSWILKRFILTTGHFEKLNEALLAPFSDTKILDVSLVSRDLLHDLQVVREKIKLHNGRVEIGAVETVLSLETPPSEILAGNEAALRNFERELNGKEKISLFYEVPLHDGWEKSFSDLVRSIKEEQDHRIVGVKLRCGGVEDHLVPSPARVAFALRTAANVGVPIKFTAGL
ncbi:MAG: hypothetical protein KDD70_18855, partial [Bdellovibrionales bacterium]|nr:hypothetical protein [Bdellovibrionales bacterium]